MSALAEPRPVLGSQRARIEVIPDGDEHPRWREIIGYLGELGIKLDEWQERILWASLLRRGKQWAAFAVGVCCPRQNGKNGVLEAREVVGPALLGERLVIHSAHLADTSKEAFRRHELLVDLNPWYARSIKHIWRTNGHEAIEFANGNRLRFRTRTRGGGRGFSGAPVMFDEAMYLPEVSMGAILPVISAQPDPQIWYTGSAVDQLMQEDGRVFARVRERALAGDDPRLAYFEWSLEADTPDDVDERDLGTTGALAQCNPALGIRISLDYLEAEARELDQRTLVVERYGVGDWPPTSPEGHELVPMAVWDALADSPEDEAAVMLDPVCLAFDVRPDRAFATIAAAGKRADGQVQVEVVDYRRGTAWVVPRLLELAAAHEPVAVMCDGYSPAASLVPALKAEGLTVRHHTQALEEPHTGEVVLLNAGDQAKASGFMFDAVADGEVRHLGSGELRSAVKGASKRPLGDAWAWSRRHSAVDISPLVAVTEALWGYTTLVQEGELRIW